MTKELTLEQLILSCTPNNPLQLYAKKSSEKSCWMTSKIHPDLNLEVKYFKLGFIVQFYGSTYDFVSKNAISQEKLIKGLFLLLQREPNIENQDVQKFLNWQ